MRKKTILKMIEYQMEESQKHLEEMRSMHKEMRAYKHDFHHHLQVMREYIETGEYAHALRYIDELDEKLLHVDTLLKTGNVALDAILSGKIAKARAREIDITLKANVPDALTLTDVELSVIIGNLLDNAMEGCENAGVEKPFMRVYIAMKGDMLYFSMMNSAGEKKRKIGSLFETKKRGVHGFGLRRAAEIIEEHGGWYKYNSEEGAFTSEFLVPARVGAAAVEGCIQ